MKETQTNKAEILATRLPTTASFAFEQKYFNACDTTTTTTLENTTTEATKTSKSNPKQLFTPTKGRSIFHWLKSAPSKAANSDAAAAADDDGSITTRTTAAPNRERSADCSALSSYRDFRGVQSLRNLWNKRITASANESTTTSTNAKAKKLNKSVSCLASVSASFCEPTAKSAAAESDIEALAKRRQTHTKRTQSLHDCTQSALDFADNDRSTREIDTLHRERDNFYKYKTAEQASKQRARRRVSSAVVGGAGKPTTQGFPATKSSDKGEHIHWLRRDEMTIMTPNERQQAAGDDMQQRSCDLITEQVTAGDKISQEREKSDTLSPANNSSRLPTDESNAASSSARKIGASSNESAPKRSRNESSTSTLTRTRKHAATARKYSFKTHSKTYHSPRNHGKAEGNAGSTGNAKGAAGYSMVAKLTQQFNEIIQKDRKLLEEVKRKNGVLMSRGRHVYKVVEKSERTATPGISRTNSKAKDLHQSPKEALNVRRVIKNYEGRGTDKQKPQLPAKSLQVLLKREELVSNKLQSLAKAMKGIKRKSSPSQTSQTPNDKANDFQLKLELNKLEVVTEESKTPLEGDERSIVEVLRGAANVSSFSEASNTNVLAAQTGDCSSNNHTVDAEANVANQAKKSATTQQRNKAVNCDVNADGEEEDDGTAKQRNSEGQAGHSEQLTLQSVAKDDENFNRSPEQREFIATFIPTKLSDTVAKVDAEGDVEKLQQRKHRYAKIYEKFRFRSPFSGVQQRKTPSTNESPEKNEELLITDEADAKIVDALNMIDRKLKGLTTSAEPTTSIVLCANDDFEQRLLPNSSFIYQSTTKQVLGNQLRVTQAVNVVLVNTMGGEQMQKGQQEHPVAMEEKNMPAIKVIEIETMKKEEQKEEEEEVATENSEEAPFNNGYVTEKPNENAIAKEEDVANLVKECKEKETENEDELGTVKSDSMKERPAMETKNQKQENPDIEFDEEKEEQTVQESELRTNIKKIYESIAEAKTDSEDPQTSFVFTSCKVIHRTDTVNPSLPETSAIADDIYQTLDEITPARLHPSNSKINNTTPPDSSQNDYESIAGSNELSTPIATTYISSTAQFYDGYETYDPPPDEAVPRLPSSTPPTASSRPRNTNDELPALPQPKRKLPETPLQSKTLKSPPPKPPTCQRLNSVPSSQPLCSSTASAQIPQSMDDDDRQYYADDENIYDTIKGSHCYESLHRALINNKLAQKSSPKSMDNLSLGSNCYESITQYRHATSYASSATPMRNAGSTSTISSDQKTNSLYEVSFASGALYSVGSIAGGRRSRSGSATSNAAAKDGVASIHSSNSNPASSDGNSDEWIDITDNEAEDGNDTVRLQEHERGRAGGGKQQQFIVVRERSKLHRSPDWSKRVRDKRLQQKAISCFEDDSDHYYESLAPPFNNKRHSTQLTQHTSSHHSQQHQELPRYPSLGTQQRQQHSASAHALGQAVISDDYDSFDTDTDDVYEVEDPTKNHHDSGVDVRNVKLPDPPATTNQVYAMVKKLKNFISHKKSPNAAKYGGSQQKIYENSSQFYLESSNTYQDTPKSGKNNNKVNGQTKISPRSCGDNEDYENTGFHAPPIISIIAAKQLSSSERSISKQQRLHTESAPTEIATTPRSKSKSGKSFKSRLRKSLVGSTFDSKQLSSTLTPTRSTFYIEDPSGSGELDSGFSEKGDLTADRTSEPTMEDSNTTLTPDVQKSCTVSRKAKKDAKASNSQRRRTTIGMRPHEPPPPPPPPVEDAPLCTKQRTTANTSWYAECGVFKNSAALNTDHHSVLNDSSNKSGQQAQAGSISLGGGGSHTSWYAEAGLYQTSGASVASSSGSSGVSTGNEAGIGDDLPHSLLQNEPLYQIYSAAKLQSISRDLEDQENDSSTDGYEEIGQLGVSDQYSSHQTENSQRHSRPSALQLIGPKNGPSRTLWSEIPEVINSCVLHTLTPRERGLQEAKFEIITSEASYLKSLNLLRSHFMNHPVFRDTNVVSAHDRKALFSYIVPVHECSERLLSALESCWQDNIMLLGLSKRIYAIAEKNFHVYISFCEQQGRMDRTLRRLKESKGTFSQNLDLLESSPTCCGLNLHSFLMLPMQRITRLPLLIDAVFSKTNPNDDEYDAWKMTFAIMNKIVTQCNEAANRCEQAYEVERIARELEFPTTIRALAIAPVGVTALGAKPRFLVKKGELTHLIWRGDDAKLTFGKKFTKTPIFAFLFSDLLVLTKRKGEQQFVVFDYCPRNMLSISSGELLPQLPTRDSNQTGKNLILMTLLENHERKTVELVLSCPSVSEQERWLQAMRAPEAETPGEKLYEQWDCPQVVTTHSYESKEPDALNLEVGDVVNVTRKLLDGWYHGERIRDGAIGWFPGNHTEEVNSAHVRARNLKQRYRLLTFTASYLESHKRK